MSYGIYRIESLKSEKTKAEGLENNTKLSRQDEISESGDGDTVPYQESINEDAELENLQRWAGARIDENNEDSSGIELEDVEDENIEDASENVHDKVNHSEYRRVFKSYIETSYDFNIPGR